MNWQDIAVGIIVAGAIWLALRRLICIVKRIGSACTSCSDRNCPHRKTEKKMD